MNQQGLNFGKTKGKADKSEKNELTTSLNGPEDLSQRLKHWHSAEILGGSQLVTQMCSDPRTTPVHRDEEDDVDDVDDLKYKYLVFITIEIHYANNRLIS